MLVETLKPPVKRKTFSIFLDPAVVERIDRLVADGQLRSRAAFVEYAMQQVLAEMERDGVLRQR